MNENLKENYNPLRFFHSENIIVDFKCNSEMYSYQMEQQFCKFVVQIFITI